MSALRRLRLPLTKIVATIGPASEALPTLPLVVDAGMRLMRLNFSHATEDEVELRLKNLKLCPTAAPNQLGGGCAVLLDTQGPEIRTGGLRVVREQNNRRAKVTIEKGVGVWKKQGLHGRPAAQATDWPKLAEAPGSLRHALALTGAFGEPAGRRLSNLVFDTGADVVLSTDPALADDSDAARIFVTYGKIAESVGVGSKVLLDDGAIILDVKAISGGEVRRSASTPSPAPSPPPSPSTSTPRCPSRCPSPLPWPLVPKVHCVAENTGELGARKGVNLPGSVVDLPAMAPKDRKDLAYGLGHDMDYVAASFVRTAEGVREIRDYAAEVVREKFGPEHPIPLIISKIESQEALDNWDEILDESDAIMVARGDLGVEVTLQTLAMQTLALPRCFPPMPRC